MSSVACFFRQQPCTDMRFRAVGESYHASLVGLGLSLLPPLFLSFRLLLDRDTVSEFPVLGHYGHYPDVASRFIKRHHLLEQFDPSSPQSFSEFLQSCYACAPVQPDLSTATMTAWMLKTCSIVQQSHIQSNYNRRYSASISLAKNGVR